MLLRIFYNHLAHTVCLINTQWCTDNFSRALCLWRVHRNVTPTHSRAARLTASVWTGCVAKRRAHIVPTEVSSPIQTHNHSTSTEAVAWRRTLVGWNLASFAHSTASSSKLSETRVFWFSMGACGLASTWGVPQISLLKTTAKGFVVLQ